MIHRQAHLSEIEGSCCNYSGDHHIHWYHVSDCVGIALKFTHYPQPHEKKEGSGGGKTIEPAWIGLEIAGRYDSGSDYAHWNVALSLSKYPLA
jgi:hypothetical protein